ncbi:hypothetical protein ACFODT_11725 [Vibrio zhugei]|uniref:DNA recombination protein RmuC n=1 Tax=Vibrio zhugei TaxID=2479546 RepID=A0ABV7C8W6_9VIBR|nr:hypothetical protein [Vibrio zhugei]
MILNIEPWLIFIGIVMIMIMQGVSLWLQSRRRKLENSQSRQHDDALLKRWQEFDVHFAQTHQYLNNELTLIRNTLQSQMALLEHIQDLVDASIEMPTIVRDSVKAQLDTTAYGLTTSLQTFISQSCHNLAQQHQQFSQELSKTLQEQGFAMHRQYKKISDETQNKLMAVNDSVQHTIIKTNEYIESEVRNSRDYIENQMLASSHKAEDALGNMQSALTQALDTSLHTWQQHYQQDRHADNVAYAVVTEKLSELYELISANERHVISHVSDTHEQQFPRIKKVIVQAYQALKSQHIEMKSAASATQQQSQAELLQQVIPLLQALSMQNSHSVEPAAVE